MNWSLFYLFSYNGIMIKITRTTQQQRTWCFPTIWSFNQFNLNSSCSVCRLRVSDHGCANFSCTEFISLDIYLYIYILRPWQCILMCIFMSSKQDALLVIPESWDMKLCLNITQTGTLLHWHPTWMLSWRL